MYAIRSYYEWCELALAVEGEGHSRQAAMEKAIEKSLMHHLHAHGCPLDDTVCRELLANDVHLNAQGLLVWRDQQQQQQQQDQNS